MNKMRFPRSCIVLIIVTLTINGCTPSPSPTLQPIKTETATQVSTPPPGPAKTAPGTVTFTPTPTAIPLSWTQVNEVQFIQRDRVTAIAIDPGNMEVMYVGTKNSGVYKSTDGGTSWRPIDNGLNVDLSIRQLLIDPQDPQIIYALQSWGLLYKTLNGGEEWYLLNMDTNIRPSWLIMDPKDSRHLFAQAGGFIFASSDAGETWTETKDQSSCPENIISIAIDPIDSQIFYSSNAFHNNEAGLCPRGLYKSSDAGWTWTFQGEMVNSYGWFPADQLVVGLDEAGGKMIYVRTGSVVQSSDGGKSWVAKIPYTNCDSLYVDPNDLTTVYCSWMRTTDGGWSWHMIDLRGQNQSGMSGPVDIISAFSLSPDGSRLFLGTEGLLVSTDGGATWNERSNGLGGMRVTLLLDHSSSPALYLSENGRSQETGTDWGYEIRFHRSTDGGRNWEQIEVPGRSLDFDADGKMIYSVGSEVLSRSSDGGQTWVQKGGQLSGRILTTHPFKPGFLYADMNNVLQISKDGGQTWQEASLIRTIRTGELSGADLLFSQANTAYLFFPIYSDKDIYISNDDGMTWKNCTSFETLPRAGLVDPRDSSRLIFGTNGAGILISHDGCQSWEQSNAGLGNLSINALAYDPNNPDTLYAGTDGGVYISFDGGETWSPINNGLTGVPVVYSIIVDLQSNVIMATPGGIFQLVR